MYLLNRFIDKYNFITKLFTFHYVSIKSDNQNPDYVEKKNLHSTMYLLNLLIAIELMFWIMIYIPLCIY